MVNSKNQVKVMDFGLAKLKGSLKLTKTSSTIGTLAYMAPEQIEGGEVDARSDIFSFGVVLFEMLTGHLPFRGEHEAAMMYAIVNQDPEPLQQYVPDAPSELLHILDRALEKDREERYQTVHEMLIDLRRLKKDSARVSRQPQPSSRMPETTMAEPAGEHKKGLNSRLWVGLAALLVLCTVSVVYFIFRSPSPRLNPNRITASLRVPFAELKYFSLSHDGNWIAFSAQGSNGKYEVYTMNVATSEPRRVTEESAAWIEEPDISPDASQIVYSCAHIGDSTTPVKVAAFQGGVSRTIAAAGAVPKWRPDGQRIGYIRRGTQGDIPSLSGNFEIWSIRPDGTDSRLEITDTVARTEPNLPLSFCWSPDGRAVAWQRVYSETIGEVMVGDLATGKQRQLTFDKKTVDEVIWATNGVILFVSNKSGHTNLWMTSASGGDATQITHGGVPVMGARISADNTTLVYMQKEDISRIWISAIDGSSARQVTFDDIRIFGTTFSPDRKYISYRFGDVDVFHREVHLSVMDRDGKNPSQLTSGPLIVTTHAWSPDGNWLVYSSRAPGEPEDSSRIYLIQPFNLGPPRLLCSCEGTQWATSPDWQWLAYTYRAPGEPDDSIRTYLIHPFNPAPPRLLGKGTPILWSDRDNVLVFSQMKTLRYSITTGLATQVYLDSTYAYPTQGATQFVFYDSRCGRKGWWAASLDAMGKQKGETRRIVPSGVEELKFAKNRAFYIYRKGDEIWRLWLFSGKEERIGKVLPDQAQMRNVSWDGKEILWMKQENRSKLVLVKNVFE
jgi:Tol biopolymer transport system component